MSGEAPKYIRKLEEDMENLRQDVNKKIKDLRKETSDFFQVSMTIAEALSHLIMSTMPNTRENLIATFRYPAEIVKEIKKLPIKEKMKTNILSSLERHLKGRMEQNLRNFSFDEAMDLLLRGFGKDLTKKLVSPDLIAEIWGFSALEKFNKFMEE